MKTILAILTTIAIVWTTQTSPLVAQFAGGDGSQNNPYQIENAEQLNAIKDHLSSYFRLNNDLDLSSSQWNSAEGWLPIGSYSAPFTGYFNGNNHSIQNLFINRPNASYQGLFGATENAVIHSLTLSNFSLTSASKSGALAGQIQNSKIQFIRLSGSISSSGDQIGGLTGYISRSMVQQVYADAVVSGKNSVGSIAGDASFTFFRYSTSAGLAKGEKYVGGFVGYYNGSDASIADCINYSDVEGTGESQRAIGGFMGYQQTGVLNHCISTGKVTASTETAGGFLGELYAGAEVRCLWDISNSGLTQSAGREGGVIGLSTAELQQKATFDDFDFTLVWNMSGPNGYPAIQSMQKPNFDSTPIPSLNGRGSEDSPYIISTAYELQAVEQYPNAHFILANNIDLTETVSWNYGLGFKPIESESTNGFFKGVFDGKGYSIKNLRINRPEDSRIALFARIKEANISNLKIEDAFISGSSTVGSLFGDAETSTFSFISVTAKVFAVNSSAGGIGASLSGCHIFEAMFGGYIYATHTAGGAFGYIGSGSSVRRLYTKGGVYWHGYSAYAGSKGVILGGLVGYYNNGSNNNISDTYSHAAVKGSSELGGLIGHVQTGSLSRSYSSGLVVGTVNETVGGFIGDNDYGFVENCFWDIEQSGQTQTAMAYGISGLSTEALKSTETFKNWNFMSRWQIKNHDRYPSFNPIEIALSIKPEATTLSALEGSGTAENPFLIYTVNDLLAVNLGLDKSFRLAQNLDLSATEAWNYGLGWQPLASKYQPFKGTFDGNNHTIEGLFISRSEESYQGLFANLDDAKVSNLSIISASIEGNNEVGALTGNAQNGAILEKITISAMVNGDSGVGGLAGSLSESSIENSEFIGSVQGHYQVGGLLGYNRSYVNQCNAIGTVEFILNQPYSSASGQEMGGLIGKMNGFKVENSFARVDVNGHDALGGLIGYIQTGSVYNSYAAGNIAIHEATQYGGLIGKNYVAKIYDSYWDTDRCVVQTSVAGDARSHEEMMATDQNYTFSSWDFNDVWAFDSAGNNDGLPFLKSLQPLLFSLNLQAQSGGNVQGANTFRKGEIVTAKAIPDEGKAFEYWMENGQIISRTATLQFSILANRNLTANFGVLTSMEEVEEKPLTITLKQNYPNPFNPTTNISVELDKARTMQLMVFNIMGQRVYTLANGVFSSGIHQFEFNAASLPSGIYLYRLQTTDAVFTKKMTLLK